MHLNITPQKIMQTLSIKFYFLIPLCFLSLNSFSSKELKENVSEEDIYICFKHDNDFVEIDKLPSTSITTFKIPRKGYETMEQRRKAYYTRLEEEKKQVPVNALYFFEFYATIHPEEKNLSTLQEVHCRTPEELREGEVEIENDSKITFIQIAPDKHVIAWRDVKRRNRI